MKKIVAINGDWVKRNFQCSKKLALTPINFGSRSTDLATNTCGRAHTHTLNHVQLCIHAAYRLYNIPVSSSDVQWISYTNVSVNRNRTHVPYR